MKQSNGFEFFYDTTGLVGLTYNGTSYVYRKDIQGNIIAILDSAGTAVVQYKYDAWGNHTVSGSNITLGNLNPFRYRSYYYDTETKLYFLQSRYYDPETGRFLNMDSIDYADPETLNGLNLYAYCNNNPVMNVDPEGTWSWKGFWNIVGATLLVAAITAAVAVGAGATTISAVMTGAAIGGGISGACEIVNQVHKNGAENISFGSIAIETLTGSSIGAASAVAGTSSSLMVKEAVMISKVFIAGGAATLHGINEGKHFDEIMEDAGYAMAGSLILQFTGKMFNSAFKLNGNSTYGISKILWTGLGLSGRAIMRFNKNLFGRLSDLIF